MLQPLQKIEWRFFKKLKVEPPHDPEISLQYTYPKELKSGSCKYLHSHINCIIIHNSRDSNLNFHQQMNEEAKCGLSIQWKITQP